MNNFLYHTLFLKTILQNIFTFPLLEKVTEHTWLPSWAFSNVLTHLLDTASHNLIEPSRLEETKYLALGSYLIHKKVQWIVEQIDIRVILVVYLIDVTGPVCWWLGSEQT